MATYTARMVHGVTGGEGTYPFEGPDDLMTQRSHHVIEAFFTQLVDSGRLTHLDYDIVSTHWDKDHAVLTVIGDAHLAKGQHTPFMCMIAKGG